jgi:hypothetical protein
MKVSLQNDAWPERRYCFENQLQTAVKKKKKKMMMVANTNIFV